MRGEGDLREGRTPAFANSGNVPLPPQAWPHPFSWPHHRPMHGRARGTKFPLHEGMTGNMSAGSADLCSSLPPTQPVLHLHRTERGCTVSATALAKQCWDDLRTRKTRGPPGSTSRIFQEKTFPRLESQQKNSAEFLLEVWKFKLVPCYQPNRETTTWKRIPGRRNTIVVCRCQCPLVRLTRIASLRL